MFRFAIATAIVLSTVSVSFACDELPGYDDSYDTIPSQIVRQENVTLIELDDDGLIREVPSNATFIRIDGLPVEIVEENR